MKFVVSLAVFTVLVLALVEARPRRNDGGGSGGGDADGGGGRHRFGGFGGRFGGQYYTMGWNSTGDRPRGGLIACRREGADGTVLEEETCPESYECINGPLDITIDEAANKIYFCNTPYPNLGMSCKVEDSTGNVLRNRTCHEGTQCTAGPYDGTVRGTDAAVKFYICVPTGSSGNPTEPNYAKSLLHGACSIDGTAQPDHDCRGGVCDGVKVTVAGQEAQFCRGPKNEDDVFEYLELFGKYGKRRGSFGRRDSPRDGSGRDGQRDGPRRDSPRDGPRTDGPRDGARRDGPRDGPGRDGPRDGSGRDGPSDDSGRDGPRDSPRRDGPRDGPRRDGPRDGPRTDGPRDGPGRDGPIDGPGRDGPRDGSGRDGPRDGPRRDGPRDSPRRDGPRDSPRRDGPRDSPRRDGPRDGSGRPDGGQ